MNNSQEIIEGKIEYESKKYSFYYINNILTLIPDKDLEDIWKTMFKNLREKTIENTVILEGITSTGFRIAFINIKLVKENGGIYKSFVPAYIVGNSNLVSPLPKIEKFNSITFYGKCLDNFFNPQSVIEYLNDNDRNIKTVIKRTNNKDIEINGDIFNISVTTNLTHAEENINTPLILKSYLKIDFESSKNIMEIINYFRSMGEFFKFLYSRTNIKFDEIKLTSSVKMKEDTIKDYINTFNFYYYISDDDKIDLPDSYDCIKYNQIEDNIKNIYLTVNKKDVYKSYYDLNKDDELKVTINKYSNISSAFESWFDINFPKFKSDTSENYKILKNNVIKFIDDCIRQEDAKENKEILHLFKSDIEKLEGSLKEQIKYCLKIFKDCISNVKKNITSSYSIKYSSEDELDELIANTFKNTRNKIAHGNMKDEILFSDMDMVAYVIVKKIVRCLVFLKSGVEIDKIKDLVDDRFLY